MTPGGWSRRSLLAFAASVGTVGLGGCLRLESDGAGTEPTEGTTATTGEPTERTTGADGTSTEGSDDDDRDPTLTEAWSLDETGQSVATDGETAYVLESGVLSAVDPESGRVRWSVRSGEATGGDEPLAVADGLVVAGADGAVFAVDAGDPSLAWTREIAYEDVVDVQYDDGVVYVASATQLTDPSAYATRVLALDGATGRVEDTVEYEPPSDDEGRYPHTVVVHDDVLYTSMYQGTFEYDLAAGRKRTYEDRDGNAVEFNPALPGGYVRRDGDVFYVAGQKRAVELLQVRDVAADEVLLETELDGNPKLRPHVTEDAIYVGTTSGVYGYDRSDGSERLANLTREWPSHVATLDGVVAFADRSRRLTAVDADSGEVVFERESEYFHDAVAVGDVLVDASDAVRGYEVTRESTRLQAFP